MGTPIMILSGGDPVNRPDLFELIRHGKARGLRMATIPAATDCLTRELVQEPEGARASTRWPSASTSRARSCTTRFRGVPGAFAKTMQAVEWAHEARPPAAGQHHRLRRHRALPRGDGRLRPGPRASCSGRCSSWCRWAAAASSPASRAAECERLFEVIYRVQKKEGFIVKVTEAPHYRRHVAQREMKDEGAPSARPDGLAAMPARLTRVRGPRPHGRPRPARRELRQRLPVRLAPRRDHAERLPADPGRQRARDAARRGLPRDAALPGSCARRRSYKGRCGRCEFRDICGGSRSRAFGLTGDPFETDPWCSYEPLARS